MKKANQPWPSDGVTRRQLDRQADRLDRRLDRFEDRLKRIFLRLQALEADFSKIRLSSEQE